MAVSSESGFAVQRSESGFAVQRSESGFAMQTSESGRATKTLSAAVCAEAENTDNKPNKSKVNSLNIPKIEENAVQIYYFSDNTNTILDTKLTDFIIVRAVGSQKCGCEA